MRSPLLAIATLVAALAACSGGGSGNALIPPFDVPAGVVVADFDGDGREDVALAFAHIAGPPPHDLFSTDGSIMVVCAPHVLHAS